MFLSANKADDRQHDARTCSDQNAKDINKEKQRSEECNQHILVE